MENYIANGEEVRNGKLIEGSDAPKVKVLYLCDGKACEHGCNTHSHGKCTLTSDISHARNFIRGASGNYIEQQMVVMGTQVDLLNVGPVKLMIDTCKAMLNDAGVPEKHKQAIAAAFQDIRIKAEEERQAR